MSVAPGALVLDYSHERLTDALIAQLKPAAVCRYLLDPARDQGKALTPAEARWLGGRGIPVVANFEYATHPALTTAQGAADAHTAQAELIRCGLLPDAPVIFSMDWDVLTSQVPLVMQYWAGAQSVLGWSGGHPRAGLYGSYRLIEAAGLGGVHWLWQTYAWSGGRWSGHALLRQVQNNFMPGYDKNIAQAADFGQRYPIGYGADMDLKDYTTVPPGLVDDFPKNLNVKAGTRMTVEELLWQCMLRGAQSAQAVREAETADQERDAGEAVAISNLAASIHAGTGSIDIKALGDQLLAVLVPAQAIALSDVLRKTHLAVDGT